MLKTGSIYDQLIFQFPGSGIYSGIVVALFAVAYFTDVILGGLLTNIFALEPTKIFLDKEFWRILTYPLAYGSPEGAALFFAVFILIAPKIEAIVSGRLFFMLLVMLIIVHGAGHMLVFFESLSWLYGADGIALFVLFLRAFMKPAARISFFGKFPVKTIYFALFLFFLWVACKYAYAVNGAGAELFQGASSLVFGLTSSLLVYVQTLTIRRRFRKKLEERFLDMPKPEELEPAIFSERRLKNYSDSQPDETKISEEKFDFTEEKLNSLLEKIHENGVNSLSVAEEIFLREYSRRID